MDDKEIISLIYSGKTAKAFEGIYRNFPVIKKMILANGGTNDDARDVFQDSVLVFYRLCQKQDFTLTSSIATLLYSISKKIWYKKIRDYNSKYSSIDIAKIDQVGDSDIEEEFMSDQEKIFAAEKVLNDLGEPCKSLLIKFYYDKSSMKEIANELGYSNEKTAKAQKYKCIERGKKLLKEKIDSLKSLIS